MSKMWILGCDNSTVPNYPNGGCSGGELDNVWEWITSEGGGMVAESCFPSDSAAQGQVDNCPSQCKGKKGEAIKVYHNAAKGSAYVFILLNGLYGLYSIKLIS